MTIIYSLFTETQFEVCFWGQTQTWNILVIYKGHLHLPACHTCFLWVLLQMCLSHSHIFKAGYSPRSGGLYRPVSVAGLPAHWSAAFHLGLFSDRKAWGRWWFSVPGGLCTGAQEKNTEHLGTACGADFEGCEAPFMCSVNGPLGLSTMYCGREKGLIHRELDLWNWCSSLIYMYISWTSLTGRGLWCWMRPRLTCRILQVWSLCILQPAAWKPLIPICPDRSVPLVQPRISPLNFCQSSVTLSLMPELLSKPNNLTTYLSPLLPLPYLW